MGLIRLRLAYRTPWGLSQEPSCPLATYRPRRQPSYTRELQEHNDKQAHKRSEAAAPILTFHLTFILGYDLFVLFESARGGHSPAVPGLLSMGKFWSGGHRPVSLERQRVVLPLAEKPEAAPTGGTGGARGGGGRGAFRESPAPAPSSGLSRLGRWRASGAPAGEASRANSGGQACGGGRLPAASSTAAGRTRRSRQRRAPLLRPARGSRPAGRRRHLPSCLRPELGMLPPVPTPGRPKG